MARNPDDLNASRRIQRDLREELRDQGFTTAAIESATGLHRSVIDFWTSTGDAMRLMTPHQLVKLLCMEGVDAARLANVLIRDAGLVAVPVPASDAEDVSRARGCLLGFQSALGELSREELAASADGERDPAERERLKECALALRSGLDAYIGALDESAAPTPRVLGGGR